MIFFVFCVKNHLLCGRISAFSLKIEKKVPLFAFITDN